MVESNTTTVGGDLEAAGAGFARAAAAAQRSIASALFGTGGPARAIAGRYQLGERLGAGAQGSVWQARDEALDRDVAIKTAHVAGSSGLAKAQEWLRHEAKMLGRVSHPNVVGVFDVGIDAASVFGLDDDGAVIFVVMELVRGRTLAQWLQEKQRTTSEIDAVFVAIAAGLQAVHDAGLVHCDVKPGNIFVTEHGVAKLGDFGLAHAQRRLAEAVEGQGGSSEVTTTIASTEATQTSGAGMTGPRGGTPAYMPPEQFRGARVDARADQYAFAGTWFEAVYRMLPHGRGTHARLFEAKVSGPPTRPGPAMSSRAFRALARGLAPDPRRRHASVVELARAVTERKPSRGLALAGFGAVAVAGAMMFSSAPPPAGCSASDLDAASSRAFPLDIAADVVTYDQQLARRVATLWNEHAAARLDARRGACAAEAPDLALIACLDRLDHIADNAIDLPTVRGRDGFQRAFSIASALPGPEVCSAGGIPELGDITAIDAEVLHATQLLTRAAETIEAGRPSAALADLRSIDTSTFAAAAFENEIDLLTAVALTRVGKPDDAFAHYQQAWDRALATDAPLDAARAARGLAEIVGSVRQAPDAGLEWIRHGQAQLARVGDVPVTEADLLGTSGPLLASKGEYAAAIAAIERALVLLPDVPQYEASRIAFIENSGIARAMSDDPGADERLRHVLAWREEHLDSTHPDLARALQNVGFAEHRDGNVDAAEQLLRRALRARLDAEEPDELEVATIYNALAGVAVTRGDNAALEAALEPAEEIYRRLLGPDHEKLGTGMMMRLNLLVELQEFAAAEAYASATRDRLVQFHPHGTVEALHLEFALARIDGAMGRHEKAYARMTEVMPEAQQRESLHRVLALWSTEMAILSGQNQDIDGAKRWVGLAAEYYALYGGAPHLPDVIAQVQQAIANAEG